MSLLTTPRHPTTPLPTTYMIPWRPNVPLQNGENPLPATKQHRSTPTHHSPQPWNTATPSKQHTPEVSSAPLRLYSTEHSPQVISALPKRINDVRKPETNLRTSPLGFTSHATTTNAFAETATKVAQASTTVSGMVSSLCSCCLSI